MATGVAFDISKKECLYSCHSLSEYARFLLSIPGLLLYKLKCSMIGTNPTNNDVDKNHGQVKGNMLFFAPLHLITGTT